MTDSMPTTKHSAKRRRFAPVAVLAGLAASAAIAGSMTGALGAFTAKITNDTNTASAGNLTMSESGTGALGAGTSRTSYTCVSNDGNTAASISTNTATCSTINKYGGSTVMVPGTPVTTTVTLKNTGSVNASGFTLTPGACATTTQPVHGSATDACGKMTVAVSEQKLDASGASIGSPTNIVTSQTLTAFNTAYGTTGVTLAAVPAGFSAAYTFTITLPSTSAAVDNTFQGLGASQPLSWQFTS